MPTVTQTPKRFRLLLPFICISGLFSFSSVQAEVWLNQDFSAFTVGDSFGTNSATSVLTSITNNNVIVDVGGNKKVRYFKAAASSGTGTIFKLSDNLATDRPQGYFSFKATMGTNAGTNGSYMMYILGPNDTNSTSKAASQYLQIRLYYANTSTNQLRIYSGSGTSANPTQVWPTSGYLTLPTNENSFQVWYNKTASSIAYTNPSGLSNQLNPSSFVVYINGVLYGSNASSTGVLPTTVQSETVVGGVTNTNSVSTIGKLGWQNGSSGSAYEITFDDVYAADSAPGVSTVPAITSATTATAYTGISFAYQIYTDPPGATSYALTGTLPDGLFFNSTNGTISGTPTTVGGPTTVALTASNSAGTGTAVNLAITVSLPVNVFSGSNPSLNNSASWSLASTPTASGNPGSFTDLVFSSTETNLTTTSGNVFGKSWNVTNGRNYNFSSLSTNQTTFKLISSISAPYTTPFSNAIAKANDVLLFLANESKLTFSPTNPTLFNGAKVPDSLVRPYVSGILQINSNSIADINASLIGTDASVVLTKDGAGSLVLSASNSFMGSLVVSNGVVRATADNAFTSWAGLSIRGGTAAFSGSNNYAGVTTLSGGTLQLSNAAALGGSNSTGTFVLSGGTVEALADYDLSHTYGTVTNNGTNTWLSLNSQTVAINGATTFNVASGATLGLHRISGNSNAANVITKTGPGTLQLKGTGVTSITADWNINEGTLFINTTASGGLGTNNTLVMNGGNLLFSKGVSSTGTYSGHGQDTAISVLADTTITLDPNDATPSGANTASFPVLSVGTKTIRIRKGVNTKSSATDSNYADPQFSFKSATLSGQVTLDVATNVETVLQAASGTGGVTKTGDGKLTLSISTTLGANSYTGPTIVNAGTLALRGSNNSSSVTIGSAGVLDLPLTTTSSNVPTTAGALVFSNGAKIRPAGTPSQASYTLLSAVGGITGTPALETPILGYQLAVSGNNVLLNQTVAAPTNLSYSSSLVAGTVGTAISDLRPSVTGTATGYSVSPALPAGLSLNTSTGVISGTPTAVAASATYTVTASNAGGSTTATVTIVVTTSGSTFDSLYTPGTENNLGSNGLQNLMNYALGGTGPSSSPAVPVLTSDTNGLTLTANIRNDDTALNVVGQYAYSLDGTWYDVTLSPVEGATSAVSNTTVKSFTQALETDKPRKFLRLKATK